MKRAVITDCRYRMSIPVIRSLGRLGIPILGADLVGTPREKSLGFYSKFTGDTVLLPHPDGEDFLPRLEKICGDDKPVILPCGIDTLLALAKQVVNDNDVRFCPHGRPVMIEISKYELEKQFGRV